MLQCLIRQRHTDWSEILGYVAAAVRHRNDLLEYVVSWMRGHFLPYEPVEEAFQRYSRMFRRQISLARIRREPGISPLAVSMAHQLRP